MLSRDSGLPHHTRNSMGTSGNVFESPSDQERISPSLPGIATRHGEGLGREPQSSTKPTPRFSRNLEAWNSTRSTGGISSQNRTMETPRYAFSELQLHCGKFPDPVDFQCWRVNFKTEVFASTSTLCRGSMKWRWLDLRTILCRRNQLKESLFLIFEMLVASALRKIISSTFLEKETVSKSNELRNTIES